jgi:hypothetical protein
VTLPRSGQPSGKANVLEHLPWRIAGLVLLGALVVVYHPEHGGAVNRLVIPVAMGVATWMLVQNLAAVTLGAGILAGIHSAPGSGDWVVALAAVLLQRFRRHIAATHEARWRHRREQQDDRP